MQIRDSGGPRGASTRAREQLRRLLSTTFVYRDPEARKGENTPFVDRWLQVTPDYLCLTLSEPSTGCPRSTPCLSTQPC